MKLKHLAFGLMFTIGLVSLLNFQSGTRIIQEYMEYMGKKLFDIPRMLSQNTCNQSHYLFTGFRGQIKSDIKDKAVKLLIKRSS